MSSSLISHFILNFFISSSDGPQYKGIYKTTLEIFFNLLISKKNAASMIGANFLVHSINFSLDYPDAQYSLNIS